MLVAVKPWELALNTLSVLSQMYWGEIEDLGSYPRHVGVDRVAESIDNDDDPRARYGVLVEHVLVPLGLVTLDEETMETTLTDTGREFAKVCHEMNMHMMALMARHESN